MKHLLQARGVPVPIVSVLLVLALGGGYAIASGSSTIHACMKKGTGVLYTGKCKKGDRKLNWSQQGPVGAAGARGPQGPAGATGATGATGSSGATNVVVRQGNVAAVAAGSKGFSSASCNAGERATGGGYDTSGSNQGWFVPESYPTPDTLGGGSTPTGWAVRGYNGTGSTNNLIAYVICAAP